MPPGVKGKGYVLYRIAQVLSRDGTWHSPLEYAVCSKCSEIEALEVILKFVNDGIMETNHDGMYRVYKVAKVEDK